MISTGINENLFASYVGLIASGYELTDKNDSALVELVNTIRITDWNESAIVYFKKARFGNLKVNPYWPRGSAISVACFFLKDDGDIDFPGYRSFIESCGYQAYGDDFWDWIAELPHHIKQVMQTLQYQKLWSDYRKIVRSRLPRFQSASRQITKTIETFSEKPQEIVFSPNLLQAPGMADFVRLGDKIVVIANEPAGITLLHEFLHPFVDKYHDTIRAYLADLDICKCVDPCKMQACGYSWDDSDDAMVHALEECFVRGLSLALTDMSIADRERYVKWNVESGFLLVEKVAAKGKTNEDQLQSLVVNVLSEMKKN